MHPGGLFCAHSGRAIHRHGELLLVGDWLRPRCVQGVLGKDQIVCMLQRLSLHCRYLRRDAQMPLGQVRSMGVLPRIPDRKLAKVSSRVLQIRDVASTEFGDLTGLCRYTCNIQQSATFDCKIHSVCQNTNHQVHLEIWQASLRRCLAR